MPGISSLTSQISSEFKWNAQNSQAGAVYQPLQNPGDIRKNLSVGTAAANGASGGGDEVFSFQQSIVAGGSATINLNNLTNVLQQAGVNVARLKGYQLRILSAADDATITPAPTASSVAVVTNIGVATPAPLDFQNGGSGLTVALTTAAGAVTGVAIGAAGTGYPPSSVFLAVPQQAGGSGCAFAVITNSSGVPTSVVFITGAGGTGYSNATVPTTPAGQYHILTGGFHVYSDPAAGGFCGISATACNVKVINTDATHAITFELDVQAATG